MIDKQLKTHIVILNNYNEYDEYIHNFKNRKDVKVWSNSMLANSDKTGLLKILYYKIEYTFKLLYESMNVGLTLLSLLYACAYLLNSLNSVAIHVKPQLVDITKKRLLYARYEGYEKCFDVLSSHSKKRLNKISTNGLYLLKFYTTQLYCNNAYNIFIDNAMIYMAGRYAVATLNYEKRMISLKNLKK